MKERQSNIELLRIVCMAMIVVFHAAFHGGFDFESGLSLNKVAVKSLWMLGELGVNCFMLISGYFGMRFNWKKLVLLLIEVQFYNWLIILSAWCLGIGTLPTGRDLFLAFFPVLTNRWWFITAYILVYILSPYLNILAASMDDTQYRKFLLVVLAPFCVVPTFFGLLYGKTDSMLFYNWFIWVIIAYMIGAYLRRVRECLKRASVWLAVSAAATMISVIVIISCFPDFFASIGTTEPAYLWNNNNMVMVALSIGVFGLFMELKIPHSRIINKLATTTLGVYLLSDSDHKYWLWQTFFQVNADPTSSDTILRILGASAIVLVVSMGIDLLRQILEKPLLRLLKMH